ncbi:ferrous iron transport protein B [Loigolactobacillus backii]|uniref:ferrous iron transport protein B n=1 Tax=Loigolactobacillus backii TaxID=375175 RepID=UPI000C1CA0A1|nr:ferrous iron transport protein B [Loigolactobacillus backii]PIO82202.1 ferrous iron transport protein B [Loigolactobacillus backii]
MTTIALFGNPNTGKTTLFNRLTDSYAYMGNWSGVTVEKKVGAIKNSQLAVVDLPGVYSLNPLTKDEAVATNFLLNEPQDIILNVANAAQLKRNLLLSIELLEFGKPTIIALNMIDSLRKLGISYNLDVLRRAFGCNLVATNARGNKGVQDLKQQFLQDEPDLTPNTFKLDYSPAIQTAIKQAVRGLQRNYNLGEQFASWLAIQFMNANKAVITYAKENNLTPLLNQQPYYEAQHFADKIYQARLEFIEATLKEARQQAQNPRITDITAKIDRVVTNPVLGLPIFAGIFFLMFKLTFDWVGTPLSNILDQFISGPLSSSANQLLTTLGALPFLRSLIVDGIIAGVGGVLVFMPQIFMLFACISILEDSGYMARAALVMDKLMSLVGLNGKAFIPLIIGFGCNVPGIMAARTIEQPKERLITTLISPYMSCSARLPIYSLFVAAFFSKHQAAIVLSLYFLGIAVALVLAKIYQSVFHSEETSVFMIELPEYHMPQANIILQGTWDKGKGFIHKAGTVIFGGTVMIWLLSYLGPSGVATNVGQSFSALIGRSLLPLFHPIGITSWEAISAILTGVLAKEVVGSTLMVLYHTAGRSMLVAALAHLFTPLSAYAFLVFILLYIPCFATIAIIKAETGTWKWAAYSVVVSLLVAYGLAFFIYQGGLLIGLR